MKPLQQISVRVAPEVLDAIEVFVAKHDYLTRNWVINRVLQVATACCSEMTLLAMCEMSQGAMRETTCRISPKAFNNRALIDVLKSYLPESVAEQAANDFVNYLTNITAKS